MYSAAAFFVSTSGNDMNTFLSIALMVLIVSFVLGLIRVFLGPSTEDRMMAIQLTGTTAVAMLLLSSVLLNMPSSIDVALVLAVLAAVAALALSRQQQTGTSQDD